jgi:hypothetical protein
VPGPTGQFFQVQPLVAAVLDSHLSKCGLGVDPCSGPAGAAVGLLTSARRTGRGVERFAASTSPAKSGWPILPWPNDNQLGNQVKLPIYQISI